MKQKYEKMIRASEYWEKELGPKSDMELKLFLCEILERLDRLSERVYENSVRSEDAFQEVVRLRYDVQNSIGAVSQEMDQLRREVQKNVENETTQGDEL